MSALPDGPWYAKTPERIREIIEQIRSGPPPGPDIAGLFYRGQTHSLPGKRDAGKSLFMACVVRDVLNTGGSVLWLDHEQGVRRVLRRLYEFGTDEEALAEHFFVIDDPIGTPPAGVIDLYAGVDLAVLDAITGQLSSGGLSSNSDTDVDHVYATILRPLAHKHGTAAVAIDHVPHGDGDRPLGSQRKSTAPDVELIFKSITPFKPGRGGRAKILIGRDRDGALSPCEFILEPDDTWRLERLERLERDDDFRPTELMELVSRYLESQLHRVPKDTVEKDVHGKAKWIRVALVKLESEGYVELSPGENGAHLLASIRPYRQAEDPLLASGSSRARPAAEPVENGTSSSQQIPHSQAARPARPGSSPGRLDPPDSELVPLVPPFKEGDELTDESDDPAGEELPGWKREPETTRRPRGAPRA